MSLVSRCERQAELEECTFSHNVQASPQVRMTPSLSYLPNGGRECCRGGTAVSQVLSTQSDLRGRGLSVLPLPHWSRAGAGVGGGKGALSGRTGESSTRLVDNAASAEGIKTQAKEPVVGDRDLSQNCPSVARLRDGTRDLATSAAPVRF